MAESLEYLLTHTPKLTGFCSVCDRAQARKSYSRRVPRSQRDAVQAEKDEDLQFGQKVIADTFFDIPGNDTKRSIGAELVFKISGLSTGTCTLTLCVPVPRLSRRSATSLAP